MRGSTTCSGVRDVPVWSIDCNNEGGTLLETRQKGTNCRMKGSSCQGVITPLSPPSPLSHARTHTCAHTCTHNIRMHTSLHTHMHTHIYMHTYMHTYTCVRTHTHIHTQGKETGGSDCRSAMAVASTTAKFHQNFWVSHPPHSLIRCLFVNSAPF